MGLLFNQRTGTRLKTSCPTLQYVRIQIMQDFEGKINEQSIQ